MEDLVTYLGLAGGEPKSARYDSRGRGSPCRLGDGRTGNDVGFGY